MKKCSLLLSLFVIIAIILMLPSCKVMYIPNKQNVPLFKSSNEVQVAAGPFDFQAAYSVNKHLGVIANAQFQTYRSTLRDDDDTIFYEKNRSVTRQIEFGAGYYTMLNSGFNLQAFGGFGFGKNYVEIDKMEQQSSQVFSTNSLSANTARFFIQPALGFTSRGVDFAVSCRVVMLNYYNVENKGYSLEQLYLDSFWEIDKNSYCFIEPAITMRFGMPNAKFHIQYIYSGLTSGAILSYMPFRINFGIHVNLFAPVKK